MIDNHFELEIFFDYLQNKYPISDVCTVSFELQNVEIYTSENGDQFYGQANDTGGFVYIFIAQHAPVDLLLILAHEYCHVLQMYIWKTFPCDLSHPAIDHPLELEAHEFAKREVDRYRNNAALKST